MRRVIFTLFLTVFGAQAATAQTTFSLEPAQVYAGHNVNLRIDNPSGCYPVPQIDVLRAGDVVTVNLLTTDAGPCLPEWATPRFVPLGTFNAGNYQVRPFVCSNAPPPLPACQLRAELPLTVLGSNGTTFTVPALSGAVTLGLGLLMLIAAAFGTRCRH